MLLIFKTLIVGLIIVFILMLLDLILCVALKLKKGEFDWKKFLDFMKSGLLPYILIWTFLALLNIGIPYLAGYLGYELGLETIIPLTSITGLVWLALVTRTVASVYKKFKDLEIEIKNPGS